ncbi:hypothetical protein [Loigolactobacillus bifermentans]|jgi:hypothetical protein|uniref:Uncharacterized protein n=1 Tax=Loigolactobacillus bifermentans DSM 20003 TaxID=1423726 RepID=A0A0R1HAV7_9LACO|nr:hypothetical protein [Loigolactobacillus bifermentans]KRK40850.1 hypothetical protein FC07_GL002602 [Loigolactobacillus bifermentans DSM 20003]QGG59603.1 hypothetical protein LB003_03405 [Loigolactobacillus bifermentans]
MRKKLGVVGLVFGGFVIGGLGITSDVSAKISIPQNNLTINSADSTNKVTSKRDRYKGDDWYTIKGTAKKSSKIYVLADQTGNDPTHYSKLGTVKVNKKGHWKTSVQAVDKDSAVYYFTPDKSANKKSSKIQNVNNVKNKLKLVVPANKGTEVKPFNAADYQSNVSFDQIARNPNQYKGQKLALTGQIMQVDESSDLLMVYINGDSDDIAMVKYDPSILKGSRVLEDDLITFYANFKGTTTYETTNGDSNTVPSFNKTAKIEDKGTAPDDYGY